MRVVRHRDYRSEISHEDGSLSASSYKSIGMMKLVDVRQGAEIQI